MKITIEATPAPELRPTLETCGCEQCGGGIPRPPDTCCESVIPELPDVAPGPIDDASLLVTV